MNGAENRGKTTKTKQKPAPKKHIAPARQRDVREMPSISYSEDGNVELTVHSSSTLPDLLGVKTEKAAQGILITAINSLGHANKQVRDFPLSFAAEMEPTDAVEAMLISQMAATHVVWATASRRLADAQDLERFEAHERAVTKLSRTFLAQMDALKKYRAKAQQTVRVERVYVNEGGQAIVGPVTHGGRGDDKT